MVMLRVTTLQKQGPFYEHELTLIPVWISKYMPSEA